MRTAGGVRDAARNNEAIARWINQSSVKNGFQADLS
jgi:hypothetical protein